MDYTGLQCQCLCLHTAHDPSVNTQQCFDKGLQGLFDPLLYVCILTDTTISLSQRLRQLVNRCTIHAGRQLSGK